MKKIYTLSFFFFSSFLLLQGQQDPTITTYMFNGLAFNPAYAGSQGFLSSNFVNRSQWLGWSDNESTAPKTQILSLHAPIQERIGLGFHISNDVIGATRSTNLSFAYAYRVKLPIGVASIGLQSSLYSWRADWSNVTLKDGFELDPAFNGMQESKVLPNFGIGTYFRADNYYVGISIPRLLQLDLTAADDYSDTAFTNAQLYRQFYFTAGGIIPIFSDDLVFKPSLLFRKIGTFGRSDVQTTQVAAPTSLDLDASLLFLQTLWVGTSYRWALGNSSHDSLDFWAAFYLQNGLRLGFAYDISLTPIRQSSNGSLEIMLGYDFNFKVSNVQSPRYF
ncbi:MAG: PorP/SprF family type IX secretion system membrane protein [Bacteroidota bacterium]